MGIRESYAVGCVSTSVWWPGVSKEIENFIKSCPVTDIFDLKNSTYLLTVDYYSRFVEVQKLNSTTSSSVITHLKSIFARFGIPAEMESDNGPQFSSQEMKKFSETYGF